MKRCIFTLAAGCALMIAAIATAQNASAQNPPETVYPASVMASPPPHAPQYLVLAPRGCGQVQPMPAQTYSYGWFGVAPRQHSNWFTDYYGYRWIWH
jgi:hypothetical protein